MRPQPQAKVSHLLLVYILRLTGFTLIKVGKAAAAAIGSGILILQIANHNGYIKINWDKVGKRGEKVAETFEEKSSKSNLMKKVSLLSNAENGGNILFSPLKDFHFRLCSSN